MAQLDGEDRPYITRNPSGVPTYRQTPRATVQAPTVAVPIGAKSSALGELEEDEGTSLTNQATGSYGLTSRYSRARDPNELIKAIIQLQEISPPGLNKQRKLVNSMEGGLGGILQSYKDSPVSAMKLRGIASGIDQLFGTNTKDILTDTTHNLAMKIPELAEMVAKERSKYSQQEQNLLNQILSDFDTTATKGSEMEGTSYRQGVQASKGQLGEKPLTEGQKKTLRKGYYKEARKHKDAYLNTDVRSNLGNISRIMNENEDLLSRSNMMELAKVVGGDITSWIDDNIGTNLTSSEQKRIRGAAEELRASYQLLKNNIATMLEGGRLTDDDIKRAARVIGDEWDTASWDTRIKRVNTFIDMYKSRQKSDYEFQEPEVQQIIRDSIDKAGYDIETFWDIERPTRQNKKVEKKKSFGKGKSTSGAGSKSGAAGLEGL